MRIKCSACGKIHSSNMEPFTHDTVKATDEKQQVLNTKPPLPDLVLNIKESRSKFVCKYCKTPNFVVLTWHTIVEESKEKEMG